jgi:predicted aspartyl protease
MVTAEHPAEAGGITVESHHELLARSKNMGRFAVEFEVVNHQDVVAAELRVLPADQVRRARLSGMVDTGATRLMLPGSVATALGLPETGRMPVRFADGREDEKAVVGDVQVEMQSRSSVFTALVEPNRTDAPIGAFVLEELDFVPDCTRSVLVPRDPRGIFSEIE